MAGIGHEEIQGRIPCPHCGSKDCTGVDNKQRMFCIKTGKIQTDADIDRSIKKHGLRVVNDTELKEYIVSHGHGDPTEEGMKLGRYLIETGDDYATAAFEVVFRGKTQGEKDNA